MVECLECEAEVTVPDDVQAGDEIACRTCGEMFVVVGLDPIEIDYPDDDDWDWDDDATESWDEEDEEDEEEEGAEGAATKQPTEDLEDAGDVAPVA